jgi:hypothetical protein
VALGVFQITGLHVIGTDCDRDWFTLGGINDGQTIKFCFGHHVSGAIRFSLPPILVD